MRSMPSLRWASPKLSSKPKRLPLSRPDVHGIPPGQAHVVTLAAESASLHSFHFGLMIAAALVAFGGLVGVVWIRNPRAEDIRAKSCPGGQLVGASSELGALGDRPASAQPTGSPA